MSAGGWPAEAVRRIAKSAGRSERESAALLGVADEIDARMLREEASYALGARSVLDPWADTLNMQHGQDLAKMQFATQDAIDDASRHVLNEWADALNMKDEAATDTATMHHATRAAITEGSTG